jgi:hypothetical protein
MLKDIRVVILMFFFPVFFYSCLTNGIKREPVEGVPSKKFSKVEVLAVEMRSGQVYRFSEAHPAKVAKDQITGEALERKEVPLDQIKKLTKDETGTILKIVDKNGTPHRVVLGKIENDTLIAYFDELPFRSVSLLYSQVSLITFKNSRADIAGLVAAVVIIALLVIVLVGKEMQKRWNRGLHFAEFSSRGR